MTLAERLAPYTLICAHDFGRNLPGAYLMARPDRDTLVRCEKCRMMIDLRDIRP